MNITEKYRELKTAAGSHQPSIESIKSQIPELKIIVDACFLSNPYATALFIEYFKKELIDTEKINKIVEFYPSQNNAVAKILSDSIDVESSRIFVCNGAVEAIQAILHNYVNSKIVINIPTFSSYYEYVKKETEVIYYKLFKEDNFKLDADNYIDFVINSGADSVVLINPNNPDGGYMNLDKVKYIVDSLTHLKNIIIDESFIHFAYEDKEFHLKSFVPFIKNYKNISIIKSMSKDFGIAGLRCGYAILPENRSRELNSNGYLWNINSIAEYFFRLYARPDFYLKYENVRKLYIKNTLDFIDKIKRIKNIKVYPAKSNFVLIEICNGLTADVASIELLLKYGVYVRNCDDKIGLNGEFIRVAARSEKENQIILDSLNKVING